MAVSQQYKKKSIYLFVAPGKEPQNLFSALAYGGNNKLMFVSSYTFWPVFLTAFFLRGIYERHQPQI
jgi:hypothetical protein